MSRRRCARSCVAGWSCRTAMRGSARRCCAPACGPSQKTSGPVPRSAACCRSRAMAPTACASSCIDPGCRSSHPASGGARRRRWCWPGCWPTSLEGVQPHRRVQGQGPAGRHRRRPGPQDDLARPGGGDGGRRAAVHARQPRARTRQGALGIPLGDDDPDRPAQSKRRFNKDDFSLLKIFIGNLNAADDGDARRPPWLDKNAEQAGLLVNDYFTLPRRRFVR